MTERGSRQLCRWELDGITGPVVVIDVLRAFTTAAYTFAAGAEAIHLVAEVADALAFKDQHRGALAISGDDDRLTAALIERARQSQPLAAERTAAALLTTMDAKRGVTLGPEHLPAIDIELAAEVDEFDLAMEVTAHDRGLRLEPRR